MGHLIIILVLVTGCSAIVDGNVTARGADAAVADGGPAGIHPGDGGIDGDMATTEDL